MLSALVWLGIGWLVQDFGLTVYGMLGVMGVVLLVIITDSLDIRTRVGILETSSNPMVLRPARTEEK